MNKARELLRSGGDNIPQIALTVDYNNPAYFARYFRETFGCIPHDFMTQHLKERDAGPGQNV